MRINFGLIKSIVFSSFLVLPTFITFPSSVRANSMEIKNLGHSSILITGKDKSVLLNPFKAVACASGLEEQDISADIILASSLLPDEGAKTAKGLFLVKPGSYRIDGLIFEGFSSPHDRVGGRRFGMSTLWRWEQNGFTFAHLGGAISPLTMKDRLLIGKPDILFIAVGGGAKVYDGKEAANVVEVLKPDIVIPVQYQRNNKDKISSCDQQGIEPFLEEIKNYKVRKVGKKYTLRKRTSRNQFIYLMD